MKYTRGIRESISIEDLRYCFMLSAILIFISASGTAVSEDNMNEPRYDSQEDVYLISNITELNWIRNAPKEDYKLVDDINATPTRNWNNGKGWKPIGEQNYEFYGTLNGDEYKINNLTINRTDGYNLGLISITGDNSVVKNLELNGAYIKAGDNAGILIGTNLGKISNVDVSGVITGHGDDIGGLIGHNDYDSGEIVDVDADVMINQSINYEEINTVGGIIGYKEGGSLINSSATGKINISGDRAGGLVGVSRYDYIRNSNSSVDVYGNNLIGGLAGVVLYGSIGTSYSTGNVTGDEEIGGLVGIVETNDGSIMNSYSTSKVNGNRSVGGLVGYNDGEIRKSHSIGNVTGDTYEGGLVGWNVGTVESSFWNTQKSGLTESDGGVGKNTSQMKNFFTFRDSPDLEDEYYESGEPVDITLKKDNDRDIALNTEENSFKLVKVNQNLEVGVDDEAVIEINGENKTLTESSNITVSGTDIGLIYVSDYSDEEDYASEAGLEFYVDNLWDLKNISSFKDVNQSYEWNIVDGESYPFLSWEEKEQGNFSIVINTVDQEGNPLDDVDIRVDSELKKTNETGKVVFKNLFETQYTAVADKEGYRQNSINFNLLNDGQTESVTLQEKKSSFNITELNLSREQATQGQQIKANVTVKNNGTTRAERTLKLSVGDTEVGEEVVNLNPDESTDLQFTFSKNEEGDFEAEASLYNDRKIEPVSIGPIEYNLTLTATDGGEINPSAGEYRFSQGTAIEVQATPKTGYRFKSWSGDVSKNTRTVTVTMDGHKQIQASFVGDRDIEINNFSVSDTEDGTLNFSLRVVNNESETITDNVTAELNGRDIPSVKEEISLASRSTTNLSQSTVKMLDGDAAYDSKFTVRYGDAVDTETFDLSSFQRTLKQGWNYFSLPIATGESYNIDDILDAEKIDRIWSYDDGEWISYYPDAPTNELTSIKGGRGYIVRAEEEFVARPVFDSNISALDSGSVAAPASEDISTGWNLIGSYWKNDISANSTEAFNSMPENTVTQVLASDEDGAIGVKPLESGSITGGRAYWVSARENATYTKSVVN